MNSISLPIPILVIEQESEIVSGLIAFLAEIKQVSLHFHPTCEAALRTRKIKNAGIILFTDTGQQKDLKKMQKLIRRFPEALSVVTLPAGSEEKESLYASVGAKEFLQKGASYIQSLRMLLRKALLSRFLQTIREESAEEEFDNFAMKISRLIRGDFLRHYRINSEIVSALSGKIYRCEDTRNGKVVALQVLNPSQYPADKANAFILTEAKQMLSFQCSGIARILEVGDEDDLHFVAAEYVEGQTLASMIERGPVGFLRTLDIGAQAADALDAAHRGGFVHGGLRPSNIIITENEGSKLLDFPRTRKLSTSVSSLPLEVLRYMSPEQLRGEEPDFKSDIFSLGSILYHAATGIGAFQAPNSASMLLEIVTEEPAPAGTVKPELPAQFDQILARCFPKNKSERYSSAADLGDALRRLKLSTIYNLPLEREDETEILPFPLPIAGAPKRTTLSRRARFGFFFLCLFLVAITAAFFYSIAPEKEVVPTFVIFPFDNSPGPLNTAYLAEGISSALIDSLSPIGSRRILPASTALRIKKNGANPIENRRDFSVNESLFGMIEQADKQIRITVWLRGDQNEILWQHAYSIGRPSQVLAVQNQIANDIARRLNIRNTPKNRNTMFAHQPTIAAAYPIALLADYLASQDSQEDLLKSVELYKKAVTIDPKYAKAYAALGETRLTLIRRYLGYSSEAYAGALEAADKAAAIDPRLADAYRVKGAVRLFRDWDFVKSERLLRHAILLNPSDPLSRGYLALLLTSMRRFPESLIEIRTALTLEPDSDFLNEQYAYLLLQQRRFDEAIAQAKKESELHGTPYLYRVLGDCYMAKGMHEQAQKVYRLSEDLGSFNAQVRVAAAMAAGGMQSEARSLLDQLENNQQAEYLVPDFMAAAYTKAGDRQKALNWLEKAYDTHSDSMIMLRVNFFWDPLRNEPEFQHLVERVFSQRQKNAQD